MALTDNLAALLSKIVARLKKMDKERHLANATNSTDWVNSMIVSSQGEKIRSRLEPGDLNKVVKREYYPMPTVEEMAAIIPDDKVLTVQTTEGHPQNQPYSRQSCSTARKNCIFK